MHFLFNKKNYLKCGFKTEKKREFSNCLYFIDINGIIQFKFQNSMTVFEKCIVIKQNNINKYDNILDKIAGKYITTLYVLYDELIFPKFLIFIVDIALLCTLEIQTKLHKLFLNEIKINSLFYKLKNIITMPSDNHFTISMINI